MKTNEVNMDNYYPKFKPTKNTTTKYADEINKLLSRMRLDLPRRAKAKLPFPVSRQKWLACHEIDLACGYGWYLGMFQIYNKIKIIDDNQYEKIWDELCEYYAKSLEITRTKHANYRPSKYQIKKYAPLK